MFYGVYQQLKQGDALGTKGGTPHALDAALQDWPASFESPWVDYPQSPLPQWSIQVEGHVAEPRTFSYAELARLPVSYQLRRLASRQGWAYKTEWHGLLIKEVMPLVTVQAGVKYLEVEDVQGNKSHFSLSSILKSQAMLVLYHGSQALSPWHGGPVRFMAFEYQAEYNLGQVKVLRFITKITKEEKMRSDEHIVSSGTYYAYDLRETLKQDSPGEIH
jgi:DMSO/TMAO reductase YedYZ molybdopterin-dependent catalytic subunit